MLGKVEGIVLRTNDYGEGNKIITVLTKEMGKVGMMARGARKTRSRLSAASQPLIRALFFLRAGTTGLASLNQAELLQSFPNIREDLYKSAYASYIAELTDRFSEDRQTNVPLFQLLLESFNQIENGKDSEIVTRIFEIKILSMFGYRPVLHRCALCQNGAEPWFFSSREGGLLCENCRRRDPFAFFIPENVARMLYVFQTMNIAQLGEIRVKDETRALLKRTTEEFIETHTELRLKTRKFLDQLRNFEQYIPRKERLDAKSSDGNGLGSDH